MLSLFFMSCMLYLFRYVQIDLQRHTYTLEIELYLERYAIVLLPVVASHELIVPQSRQLLYSSKFAV